MPVLDEEYEKLLEKAKDPEKSFTINISELLTSYMQKFSAGNTSPNFSAAALILQSCGFVYGKKVEYLHNLVTQLAQNMSKFNKNEGISGKKEVKEREKVTKEKEARINDPFFSTDIKPGKNLSCLKRKKVVANKKQPKKTVDQKQAFVPVDLLPLEGEEKGEPFYDVRGILVGNQGDFNLNKCRITASGWLLLPTISPEMISESNHVSTESADSDSDLENLGNDDFISSTPDDEGYPSSTGASSAPSSSQVPNSQQSDEGIGASIPCTPEDGNVVTDEEVMEGIESPCATEGIENIPTDDVNMDLPQRTLRRSTRQALTQRQLQHTDNHLPTEEANMVEEDPEEDSELCPVKKAIQKKNTFNLPNKLKSEDAEEDAIFPASQFCARTFFSYGNKQFQKGIRLGVPAFGINSKFVKRLSEHHEFMKSVNKKKKASSVSGDDDDLISLGEEIFDSDEMPLNEDSGPGADEVHLPNLGDNEIVINTDPVLPESQPPEEVGIDRLSEADAQIADDLEDETFVAVDHRDSAFRGRLNEDAGISEKVFAWQQKIQPILDSIAQREQFDINQYGDQIMDSFPLSKRKDSISFMNFCKGKEKWDVHRYFMALLPLVNDGNVSIEKEITKTDDSGKNTEDIFVTMRCIRMHLQDVVEYNGSNS